MLKNIAHFTTGSTYSGFSENEDGSITKSALLLVEGDHVDNKGRNWSFDKEFITDVAQNTNDANRYIPVLKDHQKTVDAEVGEIADVLTTREITEEDLPDKRQKQLIGKLGLFCDSVVIKAKDIVEKVKSGLARTISPGVDTKNRRIVELSLTPTPAIAGLSLFKEGNMDELQGVYSLDEAEAMAQTEDDLKEEFMQLSVMFYKVISNITQAPEGELGEEGQMLLEKAFEDYEMRIRDLFSIGEMEMDEDGDDQTMIQQNPYALQQSPNMEAPYSLYSVDNAEFAFGPEWLRQGAKRRFGGLKNSFGKAKNIGQNAFGYARRGRWDAAKGTMGNYFTKQGGGLNLKRSGLAAAGVGAAGYGAYRLGKAGLGMLGIGRKKEEPQQRRFGYRGF